MLSIEILDTPVSERGIFGHCDRGSKQTNKCSNNHLLIFPLGL